MGQPLGMPLHTEGELIDIRAIHRLDQAIGRMCQRCQTLT